MSYVLPSRFDLWKLGQIAFTIREDGGGGELAIVLAKSKDHRFYHGDATHDTDDSKAPADGGTDCFGVVLATKFGAPLLNTYTVTFNPTTGKYTIARATGTRNFSILFGMHGADGLRARWCLGYSGDKGPGTTFTSDRSPHFWARWNNITGIDDTGGQPTPYAEGGDVGIANDGTAYGVGAYSVPDAVRWEHQFHSPAEVFSQRDTTGGDVWTARRFWDHHRRGERFLVFDPSVSTYTFANRKKVYVPTSEWCKAFPIRQMRRNLDLYYAFPVEAVEQDSSSTAVTLISIAALNYSRTGAVRYQDSAATLKVAAANVLPWQDVGDGDGSFAWINSAITNVNPESDDITTWATAHNLSSRVDDYAADPEGATEMGRAVSNGGGSFNGVQQGTAGDADPRTFSIWYKATVNTGAHQHSLRVDGGSVVEQNIAAGDNVIHRRGSVTVGTGTASFNSYAFINANGASGPAAPSGDDLLISGAQVEESRYPRLFVLTDGATATAGAGTVTGTSGQLPSQILSGKFYFDVKLGWLTSELVNGNHRVLLSIGGTNNRIAVEVDGTGARVRVKSGGSVVVSSNYFTATSRHIKMRVIVDAAAGTLELSGATTGNGKVTGTPWSWTADAFRLGGNYGGSDEADCGFSDFKAAA